MAESSSLSKIEYYKAENGSFVPAPPLSAQDIMSSTGDTVDEHITNKSIHLTAETLGVPNGVATLDENGRLSASQLPASVTGSLNYRGTFNPATGKDDEGNALPTPTMANKGWYWIAAGAGVWTPPGNGEPLKFTVRDWLVSNGTDYDEIDNSDADEIAQQAAAAAQTSADDAQSTANTALTASGNAQATANTALAAANILDAAFCASLEDMQSKNLRNGAIVLLQVTPDAP